MPWIVGRWLVSVDINCWPPMVSWDWSLYDYEFVVKYKKHMLSDVCWGWSFEDTSSNWAFEAYLEDASVYAAMGPAAAWASTDSSLAGSFTLMAPSYKNKTRL